MNSINPAIIFPSIFFFQSTKEGRPTVCTIIYIASIRAAFNNLKSCVPKTREFVEKHIHTQTLAATKEIVVIII